MEAFYGSLVFHHFGESMSLRDDILAASDLPREAVSVPEWGTDLQLFIRTMTGAERDAYEGEMFSVKGTDVTADFSNKRAKLIARTLVDGNGNRVFTDADAASLGGKSNLVLDRLFEIAQRLNGMRQSDVDDAVKNSEAGGPTGSSSSTSPNNSDAPSAS